MSRKHCFGTYNPDFEQKQDDGKIIYPCRVCVLRVPCERYTRGVITPLEAMRQASVVSADFADTSLFKEIHLVLEQLIEDKLKKDEEEQKRMKEFQTKPPDERIILDKDSKPPTDDELKILKMFADAFDVNIIYKKFITRTAPVAYFKSADRMIRCYISPDTLELSCMPYGKAYPHYKYKAHPRMPVDKILKILLEEKKAYEKESPKKTTNRKGKSTKKS